MYVYYSLFTKKNRHLYLFSFDFGRPFLDEKFHFQIANFLFFSIFGENEDFSNKYDIYDF